MCDSLNNESVLDKSFNCPRPCCNTKRTDPFFSRSPRIRHHQSNRQTMMKCNDRDGKGLSRRRVCVSQSLLSRGDKGRLGIVAGDAGANREISECVGSDAAKTHKNRKWSKFKAAVQALYWASGSQATLGRADRSLCGRIPVFYIKDGGSSWS